jgi:hypothetical protein
VKNFKLVDVTPILTGDRGDVNARELESLRRIVLAQREALQAVAAIGAAGRLPHAAALACHAALAMIPGEVCAHCNSDLIQWGPGSAVCPHCDTIAIPAGAACS